MTQHTPSPCVGTCVYPSATQTRGTTINGKPLEPHKPAALAHGHTVQFGGAGPMYKLDAPHLGTCVRWLLKLAQLIYAACTWNNHCDFNTHSTC